MNIEEIPWWVSDEAARQSGELTRAYADRNRLEKRVAELTNELIVVQSMLRYVAYMRLPLGDTVFDLLDFERQKTVHEMTEKRITAPPTESQIDQAVKQLDQMAAKLFAEKHNEMTIGKPWKCQRCQEPHEDCKCPSL